MQVSSPAAAIDRQLRLSPIGRSICLGIHTISVAIELPDAKHGMNSLIVCQHKIAVAMMTHAIEIPIPGHVVEDKNVLVLVLAEDEELAVRIHPAAHVHRNGNNCWSILV